MPHQPEPYSSDAADVAARSAARNTDSGPAHIPPQATDDAAARKAASTNALAASMPHNSLKPLEHGVENGLSTNAGLTSEPDHPETVVSTLSEQEASY